MTPASASELLYATATAVEARPLLERLGVDPPYPAGRPIPAGGARILVAGVGTKGVDDLRRTLRELRPSGLVNLGIAGALTPSLPAGEVVVVRSWLRPEEPHDVVAVTDERLAADVAGRLDEAGVRRIDGDAITVGAPFHDPVQRDRLHAATGASIVEMEGTAWHRCAAELEVPFVAVRIVSDHADRRLPDFRDWLLSPDGEPRWGRFVVALLRSGAWRRPLRETRKLLAAADSWRAAMEGLAAVSDALAAGLRQARCPARPDGARSGS